MRPHPPRWLAWALGGTAAAVYASTVVAVWVWPEIARAQLTTPAVQTVELLGFAGAPVVGTLVAVRRPGNRYGWLLLSLALAGALTNATTTYGTLALLVRPAPLPLGWAAAWSASALWSLTMLHLPFLLLLFPDGRLPSRRWRWLPRVVVVVAVAILVSAPLVPGEMGVVPVENPIGLGGAAGSAAMVVLGVAVLTLFATTAAAGVSVMDRRRRAGARERLQLRWFGWAAGMFGALLVGTGGGAYLLTDPLAVSLLMTLALGAVFAAIGVAVLRYRLYEIDRIVSRTVSYAALTAVLASTYVLGVMLLSRLLAPLAAGSELAVAAATLVAAAAFTPARRHIQARVDRRFNRARYDAAHVLASFRQRLRHEVDLGDVVAATTGAVHGTVHPSRSSLWLRGPSPEVTP